MVKLSGWKDFLEMPLKEFGSGGGGGGTSFLDGESFGKRLMSDCEKSKTNGSSLAFAFLLYDEGSPHIAKILSDYDYWKALDHHAGELLTVFALHRRPEGSPNGENRRSVNRMTRLGKQPFTGEWSVDLRSKNELTRKYFKIRDLKYPALLFFQVHSMEVVDTLVVELKADKVEEGFVEIRQFLTTAVDALKLIEPQYKGNYCEIFENLVLDVKTEQYVGRVKRVSKNFGSLIGFLSSLRGLA